MTTDYPQSAPAPSLLAALFGDGSLETAVPPATAPAAWDAPRASTSASLPAGPEVSTNKPASEDGAAERVAEPLYRTNGGQLEGGVLTDLSCATLEEDHERWIPYSATADSVDRFDASPSTIIETSVTTDALGLLPLADVTQDLVADPLASAEEILAERGIGSGHDVRDVLAILPPELLMPRILFRCLPGLEPSWPVLRYLITDAVHAAGQAFVADPAESVLPLLDVRDEPPASIGSVETDPFQLFWHEVSSHRLLT